MDDKNKKKQDGKAKAIKNEGNNQWTNSSAKPIPDNRERRDGPGGENGKKK